MRKQSDPTLMLAGAAAMAAGVPQLTLRRWARRNLIPFRVDSSGRRVFDTDGIEAAKRLRGRKGHKLEGE